MGRKASEAVCDRGCFGCIHLDCILDAGPNLEEYRLSAELDRIAWLESGGREEELTRWQHLHRSRQDYWRKAKQERAAADRERLKAQKRAWDMAHREQRAAWQAAYRESHREECNAKRREYRAANRDAINAYQRAYRARKKAEAERG